VVIADRQHEGTHHDRERQGCAGEKLQPESAVTLVGDEIAPAMNELTNFIRDG
jgi:hypothetical protein